MSVASEHQQTAIAKNGIAVVVTRPHPVHPGMPNLPEDAEIQNQDGTPFVVKATGARVTFGDIPIERRWAIDKEGKVLDQRDFEDLHFEWYTMHFRAADKAPDDPTARPVPLVDDFISETVAPDGINYITVGFDPHRPAEGPVRRPDFDLNDPNELGDYRQIRESETVRRMEERGTERDGEVSEMRKELDELRALVKQGASAPSGKKKEMESAPCGKDVTKGRVKAHMNFCKKPECNPEPEAA